MSTPLLVTAYLAAPLCGDAPRLDGLLEYQMSLFHPKGVPGWKITRATAAPPQGEIPIPLLRRKLGPWLVGACSDPIYPVCDSEYVEHVAKRIGVEESSQLHPDARMVVSTTNSWTKSYRLPLRIRRIACVKWFAFAERRELLKVLRRVTSLGKKISVGYGLVDRWGVVAVEEDYSWYAPHESGTVLMATLPVGDWLPRDLIGCKRDFGAATPPYWHPDRYTEIVKPC